MREFKETRALEKANYEINLKKEILEYKREENQKKIQSRLKKLKA
jgi:hypothetical protein